MKEDDYEFKTPKNFKKKRPPFEREENIEDRLRTGIEKLLGEARKYTSPNHADVPDRLCLLPTGLMFFVECKSTGEKLRPGQEREKARLEKLGFRVFVVDCYSDVDNLLRAVADEIMKRRGGI